MSKMLSKFRLYESKLITFSKLIDTEYRGLWREIYWSWGMKLTSAFEKGYKNLVKYYMIKLHNNGETIDNYTNMVRAITGGHRKLIDFFRFRINNTDNISWGWCTQKAIERGWIDLVQYFNVQENDNMWIWAIDNALKTQNIYLIKLILSDTDKNYRKSIGWNICMDKAEEAGYKNLVKKYRTE